MMGKKKSILDLHKMKKNGEKVTWVTAYDFPKFADRNVLNYRKESLK